MSDLWNISLDDGETFDKFIDTDSVHWDDAGDYVGKNLIPFPYPHISGSTTQNGITYNVNSDGTISANGTAGSGNSYQDLIGAAYDFYLDPGTYTISDGVNTSDIDTRIQLTNQSGTVYVNQTFTLDQRTGCKIYIRVGAGQVLDNVTFKPMLRLASIIDDTYKSYLPSNRKLAQSKISWQESNNYINKNLVRHYYEIGQSCVVYGVTMTINSDNSINLNGTCSTSYNNARLWDSRIMQLKKGTYCISGLFEGCPGDFSVAWINIVVDQVDVGNINKSGGSFILTLTEDANVQLRLFAAKNIVLNNVDFNPSIIEVDDTSSFDNDKINNTLSNQEISHSLDDMISSRNLMYSHPADIYTFGAGGDGVKSYGIVNDSPTPFVHKTFRITGNTQGNKNYTWDVEKFGISPNHSKLIGLYKFSAWVRGIGGSATALIRIWGGNPDGEIQYKPIVGTDWTYIEYVFNTKSLSGTNAAIRCIEFGVTGVGSIEYIAPSIVPIAQDPATFHKGDVFTMQNQEIPYPGMITGAGYTIMFSIILPKMIGDDVTGFIFNNAAIKIRGTLGYVEGMNQETYNLNNLPTNVTKSTAKAGNVILVYLNKTTEFSNVNNNTPLSVTLQGLQITFT